MVLLLPGFEMAGQRPGYWSRRCKGFQLSWESLHGLAKEKTLLLLLVVVVVMLLLGREMEMGPLIVGGWKTRSRAELTLLL
jgi:hypothetical protein